MDYPELQRFVDEAHNIVDGYIGANLPDDVEINPAEGVITNDPHHTVIETDHSISVLTWMSIPKTYFKDHEND